MLVGLTQRDNAHELLGDIRTMRKAAGPIVSLSAGDNVLHPKFGLGTVVSTAGADEKAEAHIDFGSEGVKRLLLRYAPVEKL